MSDMPRTWWSPSEGDWCAELHGRVHRLIGNGRDALPADAVELVPAGPAVDMEAAAVRFPDTEAPSAEDRLAAARWRCARLAADLSARDTELAEARAEVERLRARGKQLRRRLKRARREFVAASAIVSEGRISSSEVALAMNEEALRIHRFLKGADSSE